MNLFKNLLNTLFCKHDYQWARDIYGEEINVRSGKRSEWVCSKCGQCQYRSGRFEPLP